MSNKLLLIEDVDSLGRSGDIVSVRPGYARNKLLPSGQAIVATKSALRLQAKLQEERKKKAIQDRKEAEQMAVQLTDIVISTEVKVDHEGHMYGSVTAVDIVELLSSQANLQIEKRFVSLKHPIKQTGIHIVALKLNEGVTSAIKLKVIPEGGTLPEPEEQPAAEESEAEEAEQE